MNNWKTIWNKRKAVSSDNVLEKLIALNGFDSGAGKIDVCEWENYWEYITRMLGVDYGESIFEFGCGAGALLWKYYQNGLRVGGCDYSKILIDNAKEHMKGEFYAESVIDVNPKHIYDYAISNSVFQYFDSYQYAINVIEKMLKTANKSIAILDVNDADKKQYAEKKRRGMLSSEEYDKKYNGLEHRFYQKSWWNYLSLKYDCDITIHDQKIMNYGNADFRYNVFLIKRK